MDEDYQQEGKVNPFLLWLNIHPDVRLVVPIINIQVKSQPEAKAKTLAGVTFTQIV